jgi:hypothetical protein
VYTREKCINSKKLKERAKFEEEMAQNKNAPFTQIKRLTLNNLGYALPISPLPSGHAWDETKKLHFVTRLKDVDYAKFRDGYHLINHIPSQLNPTCPKLMLSLIENCKISMR